MIKKTTAILLAIITLLSLPLLPSYAHDVGSVVNYAYEHWNDGKGQCAEFVSDCLAAAGIEIPDHPYYFSSVARSYGNVSGPLQFWTNPYKCSPALLVYLAEFYNVIPYPKNSQISVGDVVFIRQKGRYDDGHVGICVSNDGAPVFAAHNDNTVNSVIGKNNKCTFVVKMKEHKTEVDNRVKRSFLFCADVDTQDNLFYSVFNGHPYIFFHYSRKASLKFPKMHFFSRNKDGNVLFGNRGFKIFVGNGNVAGIKDDYDGNKPVIPRPFRVASDYSIYYGVENKATAPVQVYCCLSRSNLSDVTMFKNVMTYEKTESSVNFKIGHEVKMIWCIPGVYTEPYALRDSLGAVKHRCNSEDRRGGEYKISGLRGDNTFLVHYADDSESIFTLNFEG